MNEYLKRDVINKLPVPEIFVYIGKGIELVGDIFLILGFLTRIATLIMALNMFIICFYVAGSIMKISTPSFLGYFAWYFYFMEVVNGV
jgi:uncharacterized membrane protein YphA (DoxX/SURF4 family)